MTESKRFIDGGEESIEDQFLIDTKTDTNYWIDNGLEDIIELLNDLEKENEELKQRLGKLLKFEHSGEHIRLSINIETGELQRHIYATGQWFGDFDRVLCTNWITEKDYQKFIDRIIEIYNTEFKGDVE